MKQKKKLKTFRFMNEKWFTFVIEAEDRPTAKKVYAQFKKK